MPVNTLSPDLAVNPVKYLVKADGTVDRNRIGGYLVRFTGPDHRDLYGEFFTPDTDLGVGLYPQMPLFYQHGFDSVLRSNPIGLITTLNVDEVGLHVEAVLADAIKEASGEDGIPGLWAAAQVELYTSYLSELRWLIDNGYLGWSSGAIPQAVMVNEDGKILRWIVMEGSLTPTPSEPLTLGDVTFKRAPEIRAVGGGMIYQVEPDAVRSAYRSLSLPMPETVRATTVAEESAEDQVGEEPQAQARSSTALSDAVTPMEEPPMPTPTNGNSAAVSIDPAMLHQAVEAVLDAREAKAQQAVIEAKAAQADTLMQQLTEAQQRIAEFETARSEPARRLPGRTNPESPEEVAPRIQVRSKFDTLQGEDMLHAAWLIKSIRGQNAPLSEQFANALVDKVIKAGLRLDPRYAAMKANELSNTAQTGYGSEWIADSWSSALWEKVRMDNPIANLFAPVEMPTDPFELPLEGDDPSVYYVAETTDESQLQLTSSATSAIPGSKVGSGKVTFATKKLALRVPYPSELDEDSIIPVATQYRTQAMNALARAVDIALLNGDTTAENNINADGTTLTGLAARAAYMAFDGIRHLALIDNTAMSLNAGGAIDATKLRNLRKKFPNRYKAAMNLAILVDGSTYIEMMKMDQIQTLDKYGPNAVILTGEVGKFDGMPVILSDVLDLADTDGKVTSGGNVADTGSAILIYKPGWKVGYRRHVDPKFTYKDEFDIYMLTATMRLDFVRRDTQVAALLYNITV